MLADGQVRALRARVIAGEIPYPLTKLELYPHLVPFLDTPSHRTTLSLVLPSRDPLSPEDAGWLVPGMVWPAAPRSPTNWIGQKGTHPPEASKVETFIVDLSELRAPCIHTSRKQGEGQWLLVFIGRSLRINKGPMQHLRRCTWRHRYSEKDNMHFHKFATRGSFQFFTTAISPARVS